MRRRGAVSSNVFNPHSVFLLTCPDEPHECGLPLLLPFGSGNRVWQVLRTLHTRHVSASLP